MLTDHLLPIEGIGGILKVYSIVMRGQTVILKGVIICGSERLFYRLLLLYMRLIMELITSCKISLAMHD